MADISVRREKRLSSEAWWAIGVFAIVVVPYGGYTITHPRIEYAFQNPHIQATPYIWPRGCAPRQYHDDDRISWSCVAESNRFDDAYKYGFVLGHGSAGYYRVGNDAVLITCGFRKDCEAENVVENAYYQRPLKSAFGSRHTAATRP